MCVCVCVCVCVCASVCVMQHFANCINCDTSPFLFCFLCFFNFLSSSHFSCALLLHTLHFSYVSSQLLPYPYLVLNAE